MAEEVQFEPVVGSPYHAIRVLIGRGQCGVIWRQTDGHWVFQPERSTYTASEVRQFADELERLAGEG